MINRKYRLYSPGQIRIDLEDENLTSNKVLVRPSYLSICAADLRYYTGNRDKAALKKKLPMCLIHEAVGIIVYDPKHEIKSGTKVVMIPNTPVETDEVIKENYLRSSYFKSSGHDGFMQEIVSIDRNRVLEYSNIPDNIAVLSELLSVGFNAVDHFKKCSHTRKNILGIWGDGSVGFVVSLILKKEFPDSKIIILGTTKEKLNYFSFADETYLINDLPQGFNIDHGFECVGGRHSEDAVNQIIDYINPEGTISLLGVSENNVNINTRMVLEKVLNLIGSSRSGYEDFDNAIKFLLDNKDCQEYLYNLISSEINISNLNDINKAFEKDITNDFKTIMKWDI